VGKRIAYWYLRHLGHIFIARNYMPEHAKGERDLIGFDRDTVALIELSITREYTKLLFAPRITSFARSTSKSALCALTLASDNTAGQPPVVRLQKSALSPFVHRHSDR
jgi:hypothetical protein